MDKRIKQFRYLDILKKHLKDKEVFKDFVYPRQLEIHLPGSHIRACSACCTFCQGKEFKKQLVCYENEALDLLENLKGEVPYHIYSGHYTEPTINPYLMSFIGKTKKYNNHFGLYTNGITLYDLEKTQGFITELNRLSTDKEDYLVISLDAGLPWSWNKTKNVHDDNGFNKILYVIKKMVEIRSKTGKGHSIRINYIISDNNDTLDSFRAIVSIANDLKVDSLRFTHPDGVKIGKDYKSILEPLLNDKTFYMGQEFVDPKRLKFTKCSYGYYQITLGADGNFYRCCKTATPEMAFSKLGGVTSSLKDFKEIVSKNQDKKFEAQTCFKYGAICDKAGLEINNHWNV